MPLHTSPKRKTYLKVRTFAIRESCDLADVSLNLE